MIIGTLLVRDEDDIIEEWLDHAITIVDHLIVTFHCASTFVKKSVSLCPKVIETFDEDCDSEYFQDIWVTHMARKAFHYNADWVVNMDVDEFWYGTNILQSLSNNITEIRVNNLYNHLITNYNGPFKKDKLPYYKKVNTRGKTIHRAHPDVLVTLGNHRVKGLQGKRINNIPDIYIHHYPIRSLAQFICKCKNAGALINSKRTMTRKSPWLPLWQAYNNGKVIAHYNEQLYSEERIRRDLENGLIYQ